MRIRRSRLTADFVQVPNQTVRDDRLSYMARGILAELLSRPDGWEATSDDLWRLASQARGAGAESRRDFRAAFAELKSAGYIVAEREQRDGGRFGTVLTVYDVPQTADVPLAGTSARAAETRKAAGHSDVPAGGTPESTTDVPTVGTPERPGQTNVSAGRAGVPEYGMSVGPGQTPVPAGRADVPTVGTSNKKTGFENREENVSHGSAERKIMTVVNATVEEAREIISIVQKENRPRSLDAYLATLAANGDLAALLGRVRHAANRTTVRQAVAELGDHPPCGHGVPGGDRPHPETGRPLCPICRNGARPTPAPVEAPKLRLITQDSPVIPEPSPRPDEPPDDVQAARDYLNQRGDGFDWVTKARDRLGNDAPRDEVFLLAADLAKGQVA